MGLGSRLRRRSGPVERPDEPTDRLATAPRDGEPITAESLADLEHRGWQEVEPMGSVIPAMPLTVSVGFDEVLPSRRRPSPVLIESLGHAIDSSGPSGLVEALVLVTSPGQTDARVPDASRRPDELPLVSSNLAESEVFEPPAGAAPVPRRPGLAPPVPALPESPLVERVAAEERSPLAAGPLLAPPTMTRAEPPAHLPVAELTVAQLLPRAQPVGAPESAPLKGGVIDEARGTRTAEPRHGPPTPVPPADAPSRTPATVTPVAPPLGQAGEVVTASPEPGAVPQGVRPVAPDAGTPTELDLATPPARATAGTAAARAEGPDGPAPAAPLLGDRTMADPRVEDRRGGEVGQPTEAPPIADRPTADRPTPDRATPEIRPLVEGRPTTEARPPTPTSGPVPAPAPLPTSTRSGRAPVASPPPAPEGRRSRSGLGAPIGAVPPTAASPEEMLRPGAARSGRRQPNGELPTVRPPAVKPVAGHRSGQTWVEDSESRSAEADDMGGTRTGAQADKGSLPVVAIEPLVERSIRLAETSLLRPRQTVPLVGQQRPPAPPARPRPVDPETAPVRAAVSSQMGLDVSVVPVDRGPGAGAQSRRLQAQAYTDDSGVHIPPAVGRLDRSPGRELLAHELTHAAQRAAMGAVPDERSPAGRRLEAQADTVAERLATGVVAAAVPHPAPAGPLPGARGPAGHARAAVAPPAPLAPAIPPSARPAATTDLLERPSPGIPRPATPTSAHEADPTSEPPRRPVAVPPVLAGLERRLNQLEETASAAMVAAETAATPPASGGSVGGTWHSPLQSNAAAGPSAAVPSAAIPAAASNGAQRKADEGSPWASKPSNADIEHMARLLYPLLRLELASELREDRDRAGRLSDTYGRW